MQNTMDRVFYGRIVHSTFEPMEARSLNITMERIRILLVDDHQMVIDGIRAILEQMPEFEIVGEALNGQLAVEAAVRLAPDVVIMDVSMPEMDGIEATRLILKPKKGPKVLILTMYNNQEFVDELIEAGATGYVLKNTGRDELREAIITVNAGQRYLSKPVQDTMDATDPGKVGEHSVMLSKREKQVVKLIVADRAVGEIARMLNLSAGTVETHKKNIFHKLGIHSTTALVKYAMERGWGNENDIG